MKTTHMKTTLVKSTLALLVLAASATTVARAADATAPQATAPQAAALTAEQRIDALILENQALAEQVRRLASEAARPRTREEAFASCMQAAGGKTSAMAAESIGSHCAQLLKN